MIPPIHPRLSHAARFHFRHHALTHFPKLAARIASVRSALNKAAVPSPVEPSAFKTFSTVPAKDLFSEIWPRGLLDSLREPLSRYHE
jgi:hypothetical protein